LEKAGVDTLLGIGFGPTGSALDNPAADEILRGRGFGGMAELRGDVGSETVNRMSFWLEQHPKQR